MELFKFWDKYGKKLIMIYYFFRINTLYNLFLFLLQDLSGSDLEKDEFEME